MAAKVGQAVLGLATALILARTFGAQTFGYYAYALSAATLVATFTRFGFHVHSVFAIQRAISSNRSDKVLTVVVVALGAVTLFSAVGGLIVSLLPAVFPSMEMAPVLAFGLPLVIFTALIPVNGAIMTALGRVVVGAACEAIGKPVIFLVSVGLYALIHGLDQIDYRVLILLFISSQVILFVASTVYLFALVRRLGGKQAFIRADAFPIVREARTFLMANGLARCYQEIGVLAVGAFFGPVEVALYRVADQASSFVSFGQQALQTVFKPRIAKAFNAGRDAVAKLQTDLTLFVRLLAVVTLPVIVAFTIGAPWAVLVFGPQFGPAAPILAVLTLAQAFSIFCGLNDDALIMTGHANVAARWAVIAVVMTSIVIVPFIHVFGFIGAALAVGLTRVFWNSALVWSAARLASLHTTVFGRPRKK